MAKLSNKELKNIFLRNWGAHEDSCCECDGCKLYDHITALEKEFDDLSGHDRKASALVVEFARAQQKTEADNAALREGLEGVVQAIDGESYSSVLSDYKSVALRWGGPHGALLKPSTLLALSAARKLLEKS